MSGAEANPNGANGDRSAAFRLAAARRSSISMDAEAIARRSLAIAAEICVYTNATSSSKP
jgi:ATP-dependent protease HslVU (ClpYQ) peptidase subunit